MNKEKKKEKKKIKIFPIIINLYLLVDLGGSAITPL